MAYAVRRTARRIGLWSHATWAEFVVETYLPAKHDQDGISCKCEKELIAAGLMKPKPPKPAEPASPASSPNESTTPVAKPPKPKKPEKPADIQAEMIDRYANGNLRELLASGGWKDLLKKMKKKKKE